MAMAGLYRNWPVAWLDRAGLLRGGPVTYRLRRSHGGAVLGAEGNGQDVRAINETFLGPLYDCSVAAATDGPVVVDLGANRGYFSVWASRALAPRALVCVEPEPGNLKVLRRNLDQVDGPVEIWEAAVTPEDVEEVALHRSSSPLLHTTVEPDDAAGHGVDDGRFDRDVVVVPAMGIDRLLQQVLDAHATIDLLKVDTEGTEVELLDAADEHLLREVRSISAETSHRRAPAVEAQLRDLGFDVRSDGELLHARRTS